MAADEEGATAEAIAWSDLPDSPGALLRLTVQDSSETEWLFFP